MTKKLVSIKTIDQPIVAMEVMIENDIGAVVITKDGKPVGILTDRDIMRKVCLEGEGCRKAMAEEIMSKPLITIEAEASLGKAEKILTDEDIRRLFGVKKGEIVGIVTQKDLMRGRDACARMCWVLSPSTRAKLSM
jgi:CBS domain-containing protein